MSSFIRKMRSYSDFALFLKNLNNYTQVTFKNRFQKRKSPAKLAGQSSRTKGSYLALLGIESASVRSVWLIKLWKLVCWSVYAAWEITVIFRPTNSV